MELQIGERVKLLHQKTEGVLKQVFPNGIALVELDGEFELEVLLREVVPALPPSARKAEAPLPVIQPNPAAPRLADGLYVSIQFRAEGNWHYELVNNTDFQVLFGLFSEHNAVRAGRVSGRLERRKAQFLFKADPHAWQQSACLVFHVIYFADRAETFPLPQSIEFRLKAKHFQQPRKPHAYSIEPSVLCDLQFLNSLNYSALHEGEPVGTAGLPKPTPRQALLDLEKPPLLVDLHIEKLLEPTQFEEMDAQAIKDHQLRVFDRCLANAIAHNYERITFVHGIGTGKLRKAIHRRLDADPKVRKHEPLRDGLFGHGATQVWFYK